MPLYEYACQACGARFELLERASEPSPRICPVCGQPARRQLAPSLLRFKGGGWYVTDYGKGGGSAGGGSDPKKSAA